MTPTEAAGTCAGDTRALLEDFHPDQSEELAHRAAMLELLSTAAPFSREQFAPGHFTASALVVSATTRRVLLIAHPTLELWLQPGGHIEAVDASPMAAAMREVLEETGLTARCEARLFDIDVHEIPARWPYPCHRHFDLRFLTLVDGAPQPSGVEGVTARWLSHDEAWALSEDGSVRRMLGKARAAGLL